MLFAKTSNSLVKVLKNQFLDIVKTVVEQDADILGKIYADAPKKIKLNNEVGMDWVDRNFMNWASK